MNLKQAEIIFKSITKRRGEIKRLQEEYTFIMEEFVRHCTMDLARMSLLVVEDANAAKILGEEFVKEVRTSSAEALDTTIMEKDRLNTLLKKIVKDLIPLHVKQIEDYVQLKEFHMSLAVGEFLPDNFQRETVRGTFDDSINAHRKMIKFYEDNLEKIHG